MSSRFWKMRLVVGLLVAMMVGCASAPPAERSSGRLEGGLLGLDEERAAWMAWEPKPAPQIWPLGAADDSEVVVFEAWEIEDPEFREQVWDMVFHTLWPLSAPQGVGPAPEAVQMALMVLDPRSEAMRFEMSFFMDADAEHEGVVLRIFSVGEVGPGVWIEGGRELQGEGFAWRVRVVPAVEESAGLAMTWRREGESWRGYGVGDALAEPAVEETWAAPEPWVLAAFQELLWDRVTESDFVSPEFERQALQVSETAEEARVGLWPVRHGGIWRDRGIDEYPAESVFWPRGMPEAFE